MNHTIRTKTVRIMVVSMLLWFSLSASSQRLGDVDAYVQQVRIGLVDEFFDRFNGDKIHPDIPDSTATGRKDNLMMLFDLSQFSSKQDSLFREASAMMEVVMADSVRLDYSDPAWAAVAHCKGMLEGKSVKFDLVLTVQHRGKNMYKWVIAKAGGELFDTASRNVDENIMLRPDDHETNFLSLKRMTDEQPFNIRNFMTAGFEYDATSAFVYLVYSGKLKIDYVEDLEFVFLQIPGYVFHIRYFAREKNNAGWLISKFYKSTERERIAFMNALHPRDAYSSVSISEKADNKLLKELCVRYMKATYERRVNEKLVQLNDYMEFMQQADSSSYAYSIYRHKLESLFIDSAKVVLRDTTKSIVSTKTIGEFCDMLRDKSHQDVHVDSLCIPVWDDKLSTLDAKTHECELSCRRYPLTDGGKPGKGVDVSGRLYVYKEETEEGTEWIPVFGDMVISVKEHHYESDIQ